ncbi:MAG: indole-3-glycerol phosphate synthase TrpC [Candidatus Gastranaerophilales bacterium]|nr:indole-3-glycerol phosphate synthase TrpC [Candidatus Gastranaerophilales bacterium]
MFLNKMKTIKEKQLFEEKKQRINLFEIFKNNDFNIISEIKKSSPSKGNISSDADIVKIAGGYIQNGASLISVLTETDYFSGSIDDLKLIRKKYPGIPILRKDFIIDDYQIYEAKFSGADMILLILALTGEEKTEKLIMTAKNLGLEVLLEIHTEDELKQALETDVNFIGVNNRNLKTLNVSLDVSRELAKYITPEKIFISESGLNRAEEIREMINLGYKGFLIGSHFMELGDPAGGLKELIDEVKRLG